MGKISLVSKSGKSLRARTDGKNVWVTEGSIFNPTQTSEEEFLKGQPRGEIREDGLAYFKGSAKILVLSLLNAPTEMQERHNRNWDTTISLKVGV